MVAGCSDDVSFTIGKHSLNVSSQAFNYSATTAFCERLSAPVLKMTLADLKQTACSSGDDGGTSTAKAHSQIDLILGLGGHDNLSTPFTVSNIDCENGSGQATAVFTYFPANGGSTDVVAVASGTASLDKDFDFNSGDPAKGSFNLTFADGSKANGSFSAQNCTQLNQ